MNPPPRSAPSVPAILGKTIYPAPFAAQVAGRLKRKLGDCFGLTQFGVNLTHLAPGAASALAHYHSKQDEFIYILEGRPTLVVGDDEWVLSPGDCYGFQAGTGVAHQLVNRSEDPAVYLEVGDRTPGDQVEYPQDDLRATLSVEGQWVVTHKDGRPY